MTHTGAPPPSTPQPPSAPRYFLGALVDAFAPIGTYFVLHALGVPPLASMLFGILAAIVTTVVQTVRRRRLDGFGLLVIVETLGGLILQFVIKDPRLLLVKPSFYSMAGAVYLAFSALGEHPLTFEGARPMATRGDPVRSAAYEQAWCVSPAFRALHRGATLGWSAAFLADAVLRVVIVFAVPLGRALWLSSVPHLAAIVLLVAFSALVGRRAKSLVEQQLPGRLREKPSAESLVAESLVNVLPTGSLQVRDPLRDPQDT